MSFRQCRRRAGLTQAEIAHAIGVDQSAVSLWDRGINYPSSGKLAPLAKLLRCTIPELLSDPSTKEKEDSP